MVKVRLTYEIFERVSFSSVLRFGKAVGRFVVGLACGGKQAIASTQKRKKRLGVCEVCPDLDPEMRQCKTCTCFVDLKTFMATEACPKGKWGREYLWGKVVDRETTVNII